MTQKSMSKKTITNQPCEWLARCFLTNCLNALEFEVALMLFGREFQ